jgi:hypothetical protein
MRQIFGFALIFTSSLMAQIRIPAPIQRQPAPIQRQESRPPLIIQSFAPAQGRPGQMVTVQVQGTGFLTGTRFEIGQPAGVDVLRTNIVNQREAEILLRVDNNAAQGMRPLTAVRGVDRAQARGGFTVLPPVAVQLPGRVQTSPAQERAPTISAPPPAKSQKDTTQPSTPPLREIAPPSLNGSSLSGPAQSSPSEKTPPRQSGSQIQVPNATVQAPSLNVGVDIQERTSKGKSQAGVLVPSELTGPMVVTIMPSQLAPGKTAVPLTIAGRMFTQKTTVTFDSGISIQGKVVFVNSTKLTLVVNVAPSAKLGTHSVTVTNSDHRGTVAQVSVVAPKQRLAMLPVQSIQPKFATLASAKKAVIYQYGPKWGKRKDGEFTKDYGMPMLDDDTVFTWDEAHRGLAEYFEIRFYARDGKTLLATRRIEAPATGNSSNSTTPPAVYRVDAALVAELMEKVNSSGTYHVNYGGTNGAFQANTGFVNNTSNSSAGGSSSGSSELDLQDGDIQWEVAGFKHYSEPVQFKAVSASAVSMANMSLVTGQSAQPSPATPPSSPQSAAEVEISERWPLGRVNAPTGLAVNGNGDVTNSQLSVINVGAKANFDANGKPTGKVDPNNYPHDLFMLSGSFDLAKAPYATHPKMIPNNAPVNPQCTQQAGSNCQLIPSDKGAKFDNVYVDWGDGTIEAVGAEIPAEGVMQWTRSVGLTTSTYIPPTSVIISSSLGSKPSQLPALVHKYLHIGKYRIRVFELAEADAQAINSSALAMALDSSSSVFAAGITLNRINALAFSHLGGGTASKVTIDQAYTRNIGLAHSISTNQLFSQVAGVAIQSAPDLNAIMDRGYLLFSTEKVIVPHEDLLASGPLNLDSVNVTFSEHDLQTLSMINKSVIVSGLSANDAAERVNLAAPASPTEPAPTPNQQVTYSGGGVKTATASPLNLAGPQATGSSGPHCASCDESMMASATLDYFGKGEVRITWYIDNQPINSETRSIGPSAQRKDVPADGGGTPLLSQVTFNSPPLNGASIGGHLLHFEAQVIPSLTSFLPTLVQSEVLDAANLTSANGADSRSSTASKPTRHYAVQSAAQRVAVNPVEPVQISRNLLRMAQSRAGVTQKLGILSPNRRAISGVSPVVSLQGAMGALSGNQSTVQPSLPKEKPYFVFSERKQYTVDSSVTGLCTVAFPTRNGEFHVTGLQNHVQQNPDGTYSGSGKLMLTLTDSPGSAAQLAPVIVPIDHWKISDDGKTVVTGAFDVSSKSSQPLQALPDLPAVSGTLQEVAATAGSDQDLKATLALHLADSTLTTTDAPQLPPDFGSITQPLSSEGEWSAKNVPMKEIRIGWSSFLLDPGSDVTIDLSRSSGEQISSVCGPGASFTGIRLGSAKLVPYTLGLQRMEVPLQNAMWGISSSGLCGSVDTQSYNAQLGSGNIGFDSIHAVASNGVFTAQYKNFAVQVPWLNLKLKQDVKLQSGGGHQAGIQFNFPQPANPVTLNYANSTITAKDFVFTNLTDVGWALYSTSTFDLRSEGKHFAMVSDVPIYYGMQGRPFIADVNGVNKGSTVIPLQGTSTLGPTPVDLASVRISAPSDPVSANNHILDFDFTTKSHLSTALPSSDMHVIYGVIRNGSDSAPSTYLDTQLSNLHFSVPMVFPAADPSVDVNIEPDYTPGESQTESASQGDPGSHTVFEQNGVDLGLFGVSGVTGSFKLGYGSNGDDFWVIKASYMLDNGIALYAPYLALYGINGGMAHNVDIAALTQPGDNLKSIGYKNGGGTIFEAGVTVGSGPADVGFIYKATTDLTIKTGGDGFGARFSVVDGKLLGGIGDFGGYFQYANHSFDGDMSGRVKLFTDALEIAQGDVNLHYGIDDKKFHLNVGTPQNPIGGKLMGVGSAGAYMTASNEQGPMQIGMGGSADFHLGIGDDSVASAYVEGYMDVAMTLQPSPLVVTGNFDAAMNAGVCVFSICDSAGVVANVAAQATEDSLQMTAHAAIDLGWPIGSVGFDVRYR